MDNYQLFQSLSGQLVFDLKMCAKVKHDKKWTEHKSMDYYDIWLITEGSVVLTTEGNEVNLEKGDVFLFYPDKIYSAYSKTEICEFIFVRFSVFLEKNIRPLDDFNFYGYVKADNIKKEYENFISEFYETEKIYLPTSLSMKGSLISLFGKITFELSKKNNGEALISSPYLKLEKAISYISGNLNGDVSIKAISESLCISEKYFITYFKKYMGISPFVYINQLKMKEAMSYLQSGKHSVKETGYLLGYSDQYTFSKAFKRYYGFPPSNISC